MKKVNLLSKAEMKKVKGGNVPEEGANDKKKACEGKKLQDACSWVYNGVTQTGWCLSFYTQPLHCSDLP